MKDLKDYLHLYLGCEILFETRKPSIGGDWKEARAILTVHRLYELENEIIRNVKPILRKLDSIIQQEWIKVLAITQWNQSEYDKEWFWSEWEDGNLMIYNKTCVELTSYLLSKSFDLFGLIDEGLAIDRATLTVKSES